jgi:hypothetical protein
MVIVLRLKSFYVAAIGLGLLSVILARAADMADRDHDLEHQMGDTAMEQPPSTFLDIMSLLPPDEVFPLAYGVELEYSFPASLRHLPYADRLRKVQSLLGNGKEEDDSSTTTTSIRFPATVWDDYYRAHDTAVDNDDSTLQRWKIVPDASLIGPAAGFEMVSPIITPQVTKVEFFQELTRLLQLLGDNNKDGLGATVNESTDLHVHVNVSHMTVDQIRNIYKTAMWFGEAMDFLQPPNHRGSINPYAHSILLDSFQGSFSHACTQLDQCTTIQCLVDTAQPVNGGTVDERRYYKLNYAKHHEDSSSPSATMEFRAHQSTLDVMTVQLWISVTVSLIHHAAAATTNTDLVFYKSLQELNASTSANNDTLEKCRGSLEELISFTLPPSWQEGALQLYHRRHDSMQEDIEQRGPTQSIYSKRVLSIRELYPSSGGHGKPKKPGTYKSKKGSSSSKSTKESKSSSSDNEEDDSSSKNKSKTSNDEVDVRNRGRGRGRRRRGLRQETSSLLRGL